MGFSRRLLILGLLALAAVRPAGATIVIPPTFEELIAGAREIFVGTVVGRQARWIETRDGRAIVTLVTFGIEQSLKGGLQTQTSLEFLGGTVGDVAMGIAEMPQFAIGDRDVLFVGDRNGVSPLVGLMYGRFRVVRDAARGIDTVRLYNGLPVVATSAIGPPATPSLNSVPSLPLAEFLSEIAARVRAQGTRAR